MTAEIKRVCGKCWQANDHLSTCTRRLYFVSMINGTRNGYLLGPYNTYQEASANVDRGRGMAIANDSFAHFYSYGTCSIPADDLQRRPDFKTIFGR
jgi:hypothetical protein